MVTPSLIDINSLVAPYAQARDAANKQAVDNRGRITEITQRAGVDAAASANVNKLQAAAAGAQNREAAANTRVAMEADARAQMANATAQGIDPAVAAQIQQSADQMIQGAGANRSAGTEYTKALGAAAALDASRRRDDIADAGRSANVNLDNALLNAVIALNSEEAKTRSQAEQQNAAMQQEAAMANAQMSRQGIEDRMSLVSDVMERGGAMGAFATPYRQTVIQGLRGDGVAHSAMRDAISSSSSYDEAYAKVLRELESDDRKRGYERDWDIPFIEQQLERAFTPDTTKLNPQGYDSLLKLYSLMLGGGRG
jgi:hypothetical protein